MTRSRFHRRTVSPYSLPPVAPFHHVLLHHGAVTPLHRSAIPAVTPALPLTLVTPRLLPTQVYMFKLEPHDESKMRTWIAAIAQELEIIQSGR